MRAGELRRRITIQQKVTTDDGYGGVTETWQDVATVWAAVEPLRGREYFAAQQTQAEVTTRIRIRYRPGITPDMRVAFGSQTFDIQAVINVDGKNKELQLMCREVV